MRKKGEEKMILKYGDILKEVPEDKKQLIAIPANSKIKSGGQLVMGAGFAKQVADTHSSLPMAAAMAVRSAFSSPGFYGFVFIPGTRFCLFQSKRSPFEPSDYKLIEDSILKMLDVIKKTRVKYSNQFDIKARGPVEFSNIHIPLPGVGLGGLDREVVIEMFQTLLPSDDDRFVIWQPEEFRPAEDDGEEE